MTTATPAVRVKKPGIGAAFAALWSAIITVLQGIEEFASAFKELGSVANVTAANYKAEVIAEHEREMEQYRNEA